MAESFGDLDPAELTCAKTTHRIRPLPRLPTGWSKRCGRPATWTAGHRWLTSSWSDTQRLQQLVNDPTAFSFDASQIANGSTERPGRSRAVKDHRRGGALWPGPPGHGGQRAGVAQKGYELSPGPGQPRPGLWRRALTSALPSWIPRWRRIRTGGRPARTISFSRRSANAEPGGQQPGGADQSGGGTGRGRQRGLARHAIEDGPRLTAPQLATGVSAQGSGPAER